MYTADLMWDNEKRDFRAEDLRTVAELVADEAKLPGDAAKQIVTKITSYAGFRTLHTGREQRFQFEHEVYFDYFLCEALRGQMKNASKLGQFLDRGLLPEEVINAAVDQANANTWLSLLDSIQRATALGDNRRRNAGMLAAACFRARKTLRDMTISLCNFVNTSFEKAVFESVKFKECRFSGVRLELATFKKCSAEDCFAENIFVSPQAKLDISGFEPGQNLTSIFNMENGQLVFSPSDMKEILYKCGMPGMKAVLDVRYSAKAERMIRLLQKVAQKYQRTNLICLEDDTLVNIFQDPNWPALRKLLIDNGIVAEESRQTSGAKKTFLRNKILFADLLRLERVSSLPEGPMGNFWRALRGV
jgi:hypothetical protein